MIQKLQLYGEFREVYIDIHNNPDILKFAIRLMSKIPEMSIDPNVNKLNWKDCYNQTARYFSFSFKTNTFYWYASDYNIDPEIHEKIISINSKSDMLELVKAIHAKLKEGTSNNKTIRFIVIDIHKNYELIKLLFRAIPYLEGWTISKYVRQSKNTWLKKKIALPRYIGFDNKLKQVFFSDSYVDSEEPSKKYDIKTEDDLMNAMQITYQLGIDMEQHI